MPASEVDLVLDIQDVRRSFGTNMVLKGLNLSIRRGEFLGLMGPNGAGKSTLLKILAGVYTADSGKIAFEGRNVRSLSELPEVGFIHQDLGIVDDLTVLENLRLGIPPIRSFGPLLNLSAERSAASAALARLSLDLTLDRLGGELAPGEKALLAVARLLSTGAHLLVVDETTSTMPPHDANRFIATLKELTRGDSTVVFVSHKLSEVRKACDRAVLLLDGEIAADQTVDSEDEAQLVRMLEVHEQSVASTDATWRPAVGGEMMLQFVGCTSGVLGPIDLEIHAGEVVGLTGLVGSGLHDVAYIAAGHLSPTTGELVNSAGGVALVAPQRETEGAIADMTVAENMTLSSLDRLVGRSRLLRLQDERAVVDREMEALNVVPRNRDLPLGKLSGGNQQKVLFGRALLTEAKLLVLCEPTRGVDVGTRRELYKVISRLRDQGVAILVVTSDAEDLFAVCDRVGVLDGGRISGPWHRDAIPQEAMALVL